MSIKNFLCVCLAPVCMLWCASCGQIVQNASEELKLYEWQRENENGTKISLRFSEDTAFLSIQGDEDIACEISGLCVTDGNTFFISDISMMKNVSFTYKVYGDHLDLTYGGSTVSLEKTVPEKESKE